MSKIILVKIVSQPHVECPLALVKDGADESRCVDLLPIQEQSEACVDLVLLQILKDEVWSDVKRFSETHCVLPGVGLVKGGFPKLRVSPPPTFQSPL